MDNHTTIGLDSGTEMCLSPALDCGCLYACFAHGKLAAVGGLDEWRGYMATGNGKGTARTVAFNGDLSAFEGVFSAGERSNCDLACNTYAHADCVNGRKPSRGRGRIVRGSVIHRRCPSAFSASRGAFSRCVAG